MKLYIILLFVSSSLSFSVKAQSYFTVPQVKDTMQFKNGVARTAWLLTSAGEANPQSVRILVYGQSISEQSWWKDVRDYVEKRFPLANITFINKAIGGFSSERLKLMAENDVVSFYPDLVLFHDYGNEADYETIIQTIRRKTTAEIALQTDHMAAQGQEWHDKHSHEWLPAICSKYNLALIDVRSVWKTYLKENNLEIKDLLVDGVHLNAHGNYLMASIIQQYFASLHDAPANDQYVKNLKAGNDFAVKQNKIDIPVSGNRVDLIWKPNVGSNVHAAVYIDEKKPSAFNTCYFYTRPSLDGAGFLRKIGQVLAMKLTDKAKEEEWAMTITSTDSVKQQMGFSLKGSLTGEDGTGTSESTFTSNSGKIIIEPTFWFRAKEFAKFQWVKPGDVLKWEVKSMCKDEVVPNVGAVTTVVQGIDNGQHRLKLTGKGLKDLQAIRVYEPPLK
jgi:hypothetical protein